jgi:hypothetical protein
MKMKKSELRKLIREMLKEELINHKKLKEHYSGKYDPNSTYNSSIELFLDVADNTEVGALRYWINKMIEMSLPDDYQENESIYDRLNEILASDEISLKIAKAIIKRLDLTNTTTWITNTPIEQLWAEGIEEDFTVDIFDILYSILRRNRLIGIIN